MSPKVQLPEGVVQEWRTMYKCRTQAEAFAVLKLGNQFRLNAAIDALLVTDENRCRPNFFRGSMTITKDAAENWMIDAFNDELVRQYGVCLEIYVTEREHKGAGRMRAGRWVEGKQKMLRTVWIG